MPTVIDGDTYIVEELLDVNDGLVLLNDGSPTRYDVYRNSSSAIDSTLLCEYQFALPLGC